MNEEERTYPRVIRLATTSSDASRSFTRDGVTLKVRDTLSAKDEVNTALDIRLKVNLVPLICVKRVLRNSFLDTVR